MAYIVTTETTLSDGAAANVDISMPAGHQIGDMTVLLITQDAGGTNILNAGAEFTIIGTQAAAQAQRTVCYFRIHTAVDEADVNFTGATDEWLITAILIRGATTLSIHQDNRTDSANSTSNFLTSGSVTTTVDNCLILSAFGFDGVFKLALDNTSLNKSVNISKEINVGAVQLCQYFNQITAGATDTLTALSEVASEGGSACILAIAEATPSTAIMSPMITKAYDVLKYYGGITTAATTVAAFIRHDGITWADVSGTIAATALDGINIIATPTFSEITLQGTISTWGSMTGLSFTGSALDNTGRWLGRTHTIAATDMRGKIFSIEFMVSQVATTSFGEKGVAVYFEDSTGNWKAFRMSRRQRMVAGIAYVYFVDLENATAYGSGGTIDWSDITRIAYLSHKRTTATTANILRVKNALLLDKVIMVDGSAASPCNPAFLQTVLGGDDPTSKGGHGAFLLATVQGKGQSLARFGVQYGNGTRKTYSDLSATSQELPLRADGSLAKRFWQIPDSVAPATYRILASANDTFKANACVIATDTRQALVVDPASSGTDIYSFAGASIINYDITNSVAGVKINNATLQGCSVLLNGGGLEGCSIVSPFNRVLTNNPQNIIDCAFTSKGTGYAIEITAAGTYNFYGNTFSGYGADGTANAAIYNNSGGVVELVIQAGDQTPTITNEGVSTTPILSPPVTIEATVLADSRVQLYNVTTATELDNDFLAGTDFEFIVTSQATVGDTIRLRVCKLGYESFETVAIFSASGIGFVVNQIVDSIYDTYAVDGSAVTGFAANYTNITVERTNTSNFSAASFYAWFNFNLTTENGIRNFFGGITATDVGNIRINDSTVDLFFDNTTATNVYQNDNIRVYRADEVYPVLNPTDGGGGIDINWRNVVYTVAVSGSPVITGDISDLNNISAADVWGHVERTLTSGGGGASEADIYDYFANGSRPDVFKANVSGLATSTEIAALNDISTSEVNAQVDQALLDYDPPTKAEIDSAIATVVVPTVEAIREEMDANSTELASIKGKTNLIPGLF